MNTSTVVPPNRIVQAEAAFAKLVAEASQRGFYGTASLVLSIQDGRIQHIRVATEKKIQ
jgi:hypothetical protein